ncbi:Myosin N-terminal SH3-like domain [Globodera pallida]|nr:Myosin N-terminal SH3-like domain [Globodera pallida]
MDMESDPGWKYLRRSREQIMEDQSRPYDSKKNCWIPHPEEGYLQAEIVSGKADKITVKIAGGNEKIVKQEEIQEMNPPKFEKTEDMSNLTFLNDASVLHNLRARYGAMLIYTYSGLFCVVINPYKRLPIYTDSVARIYIGKRRTEMPPHLFAVSDEAYRNMLQNHENQSMLITGESGAGKTENTKKVICYFAEVGASQQQESGGGKSGPTLEDQIVQTNPVLEAFGNAKTVRNNNSSRFGKFIRIHFNKQGKLASCDIEHYLLEKSRVIRQAPGERCYHIFYQIQSGFLPDLKKQLLFDLPTKDYYFIAQAELTIDGVNDLEEHQLTHEAFKVLNFTESEIQDVYRLVSGIMHMGNMKFKQRPREEQAEADGTGEAEKASKMYGANPEEFLKALLKPRVKVGTEWVSKGQNQEQVAWSVGAMAKGLYTRIFNWLVVKCNVTLAKEGTSKDFFIGVLDIAGFEIFDFNSFEQLWINFVNEKLQQFFNHHMFACIELIEKPMGIIAMLDEECIVPKASDLTLAAKLLEQHLGKHPNFEKPKPPKGKQAEAHFAMRHYAGTVRYNVSSWLEKNKDPLNDTLVGVLKASTDNALLVELWSDYTTQICAAAKQIKGEKGGAKKKGKGGSFQTISMIYRDSLNNLMNMLHQTHPHFIRCIIPNEKKQSGLIDAALVLNQLTCNGVLEGIRICRKGFPNRTFHPDFVQRYALLAADEAAKDGKANPKAASTNMMARLVKQGDLGPDQFKIGHTKVFFRAGVVAHIEDLRDTRLSQLVTGFQAMCRWHCAKLDVKRRHKQISAYRLIQSNIRAWLMLRTWSWFKLYSKVRPLCVKGKAQQELEKVQETLQAVQEGLQREQELTAKLEHEAKQMAQERDEMHKELEKAGQLDSEVHQRLESLSSKKEALESESVQVNSRLASEESRAIELQKERKRTEAECDSLKKNITETDVGLRKLEAEKQAKDNQLRTLADEMHKQELTESKLARERKQQQELAAKLQSDVQAEGERNAAEKAHRQKLQQTLESVESEMDRERRARADQEKARRKLEGEVRITRENLDEMGKQRQDMETSLKRKEADMFALSVRFEEAQSQGAKLQRQAQEMDARCKEMEAELEAERQARARSERGRGDIQYESDELQERLEQQTQAAQSQIETNKKKDAEVAKLRREIDQLKLSFETQATAMKKKGASGCTELHEQVDQVQRMKNRAEKERIALQRHLEMSQSQLDDEAKQRMELERREKTFEGQLLELRLRTEEQGRQIQELQFSKQRLQSECGEFARQVEDLESQATTAGRLKSQFFVQAEELKRAATEEQREKQALSTHVKNLQHELEQLRDTLEEELASKSNLLRQLSREQAEAQQWRSKFESEGLVNEDELDELRRKQLAEIAELQNELDAVNARLQSLEKQRARLSAEADSARIDADALTQQAHQMEKRQRAHDKQVDECRHQADDLQSELDAVQREARMQAAEAHRLATQQDSLQEQVEGLRRENRQLGQETRDMQDQLGENQRAVNELEKQQRQLEAQKDELQHALDEAEAALEAEEGKVMRAQVELSQIRAEIEKRLQEKEEEFENTRKLHQRTIEGMQASLDQEAREKAELARVKKKLEADVNELELALEHANRANEEAQKNIRRYGDQQKELQAQIEEDQRRRDDFREKFMSSEKRLQQTKQEQDDLTVALETTQRFKKQMEGEFGELQMHNNELQADNHAQHLGKQKLEQEWALLRADLTEAGGEVLTAQEHAKHGAVEAARLAEELRVEQERTNMAERQRKLLEMQVKEMQVKIEEAEVTALKTGPKFAAKLEGQLKAVDSELEGEQRRQADACKSLAKAERRARELQFQAEEERKNYEKLCDLAEKLQVKIRAQKKLLDDTEEHANISLQKYRQIQISVDNAEERAGTAESSLARMRSRSRLAVPSGSGPLAKSETFAL